MSAAHRIPNYPPPQTPTLILHTKNTCKPLANSIQIQSLKKNSCTKTKLVLPEGHLFIYVL